MRILVTGSAGFIGFHLTRRLLERDDEVVGIDSLNDYYDPTLKYSRLKQLGINIQPEASGRFLGSTTFPGFKFLHGKMEAPNTMEKVFEGKPFDIVINLAAQAGVRYSIENPRTYIDSNITGFLNVLEGCRNHAVGHLIFASSSSVYGLNTARPYSVHDRADHPVSLYAATKRSNELMAHTYSHLFGLPATGLRFFTVYGPWGRPDMAYFKFAKAIMAGTTIDVYNNGDMLRDFTYIDDIVDGIVLAATRTPSPDAGWDPQRPDASGSSAPYRLYNLGNNSPVRLGDFIQILEHALAKEARKQYLPMQPGDVYATEADISDMEKDFGWKPKTDVLEGLKRFAAWFTSYYAIK